MGALFLALIKRFRVRLSSLVLLVVCRARGKEPVDHSISPDCISAREVSAFLRVL